MHTRDFVVSCPAVEGLVTALGAVLLTGAAEVTQGGGWSRAGSSAFFFAHQPAVPRCLAGPPCSFPPSFPSLLTVRFMPEKLKSEASEASVTSNELLRLRTFPWSDWVASTHLDGCCTGWGWLLVRALPS